MVTVTKTEEAWKESSSQDPLFVHRHHLVGKCYKNLLLEVIRTKTGHGDNLTLSCDNHVIISSCYFFLCVGGVVIFISCFLKKNF